MMPLDLAKLRALAEAATPGPWATDLPGNWDDVLLGGNNAYCVKASDRAPGSDDEAEANARFIAAANPTTVLALVAEIERITKERDARPEITAEDAEMYLVLVHDGWEGAAEKALVARVDGALREHAKGAF